MRVIYIVLAAWLVKLTSGACDPFTQLSAISMPGTPSCPGNTMTISSDVTIAQVSTYTTACAAFYSTVAKGYSISAQASSGDSFEFAIWHQETDGHCTVELGYNNGGSYSYLLDAGVTDQNGLGNDPALLMPFYNYKKWYVRTFPIPSAYAGKQLALAFRCSAGAVNTGSRTFFVSRVKILTSTGTTRANIPVECAGVVNCNPACAWNFGACLDAGASKYCVCIADYAGADCTSPICATGCVNGGCNTPGQCICNSGWTGALCTVPTCANGCVNGGCSQPGQCNCNAGWSGALCDQAICANGCVNGGCNTPGQCICSPGWTGALCDVPTCATDCVNGGCSQPGQCDCNAGWQGTLCDKAICSVSCNVAGATCNLPGECNCNQGWSGVNCDATICKSGCQYGTCQVAGECNCLSGWSGDLCTTFVCTQGCGQGNCTGPDECTCDKGHSGDSCEIYCALPQPSEDAECVVMDGESVWVVNGTLTINSTITINTEVVVFGDLIITDNGVLTINDSLITVFGCLEIQNISSLFVTLTPQELSELQNSGVLNRTLINFSPFCDIPNDFEVISVTNGQTNCALIQSEQVSGPGLISILVTLDRTTCNTDSPSASLVGGELVDWQIAVIVVASVVAAGAAILTGILVRKHQLANETKLLSAKN